MLLSSKQVFRLQEFCERMRKEDGVRFAGIINQMGNLVAGGFSLGIEPYASYAKQHMMYMQLVLEIKMRREFDDVLGPVDYIHSKRGNLSMLSIPKGDFLVLLSVEHHVDIEKLHGIVNREFESGRVGKSEIPNVHDDVARLGYGMDLDYEQRGDV